MVIEPLLIDEDYYARVEGREIISNLAKVSSCVCIEFHVINVFIFQIMIQVENVCINFEALSLCLIIFLISVSSIPNHVFSKEIAPQYLIHRKNILMQNFISRLHSIQ